MSFIQDGFSTVITFASSTSVYFKEKAVQPPGVDGGGAIDVTTMRNTSWKTKLPKQLLDMSDASFSVQYDPHVYSDIVNMIGTNQLITITFPDAHYIRFWGFLDSFKPSANKIGEEPTAECVIVASNMNGSQVETAPVYG